jgi:hypothetical protein
VTTAAAALAGVVVAHSVGSLLAFSDAHQRAQHLAATGHGYWPVAVWLAMAAGGVAAMWATAAGAGFGLPAVPRFGALAGCQLVAFGAMEALERLSAGLSPAVLLHAPDFRLGLALQVTTAGALVLVLRRLHRIADRVAAHFRASRPLRSPSSPPPARPQARPRSAVARPTRSRAPPRTSAALPACVFP